MARFDFVSPGAMAGNAIEDFFVKRALAERQKMEDDFRRTQAEETQARQAQALALQQQQEARIAEAQRQTIADAERNRQFLRATTIAQNALPGDVVDEQTAAQLREAGYGSQIQQGQPVQGPQIGEDAGVPLYQVTPGVLQMRGGEKYLSARTAAQERAAQIDAQNAAALERARETNQSREDTARMMAGLQGGLTDLRAQGLRLENQVKQEKLDTATTAKQAKADAATQYSNEITTLVNDLLDPSGNLKPEVAHIVGPVSGRTGVWTGDQQTALEKINRLVSLLDINKLREMKSQSATGASGFGQLSEKELGVLEAAGSTLRNRLQGEGNYATELARIKQTMGGGAQAAKKPTARELIEKYSR